MVLFLALRNIAKNKINTAIVALLVAVICFLFFIGNSVIERINIGLHQAFIGSLTGDVVIQKKGDVTMNLFGANTPIIDDYFSIPVFPAYDMVMEIVRAEKGINGITSQVSGKAYLDLLGVRYPALLCGVDAQVHFDMFPGIILEQGRFLQSGEYGAMITAERAQKILAESGTYPRIGSMLLFTSGGEFGFKIREVPLVGIFSYQNPGLFMNEIIIVDPQTVRVLNSIQVAASSEVPSELLSGTDTFLLSADIDDLFNIDVPVFHQTQEGFSAEMLQSWLAENAAERDQNFTGGDWNFIIINLEKGINSRAFIDALNKKIAPYDVVAVDWRTSAGVSAILMLLLQVLFNAGMFLICAAGIIAAINIVLISVFRRTREIGTLRAIGSSDFFISSLILHENLILSIIAGIAGVFAGSLFIEWINYLAIPVPNELVASLLGGEVLNLGFMRHVAFYSILLSIVLGVVVSIYPIYVTLKIQPIEAVRKN